MNNMAMFKVPPGCQISVGSGSIFIRVLGENNDPGVTEALRELDEFRISLNENGILHRTTKRRVSVDLGEQVVDCISFNLAK